MDPGSNIERYKKDLDRLVLSGQRLKVALLKEYRMEQASVKTKERIEGVELPQFSSEYQIWYSEAQAVIRQLLPDRLADFCSYYERPNARKEVTVLTYRIADAVQGVTIWDTLAVAWSRRRVSCRTEGCEATVWNATATSGRLPRRWR